MDEDSGTTSLDVLSNDSTAPDVGETLTITSVSAGDQGGSITINAGTSIDYTPTNNFFGTEIFTYTINDGTAGSDDTATVTITVDPVNDLPTANDNAFTVDEDSGITSLDVLNNDTSAPDVGETLTITSVSAGDQGGTVTINAGTSIDYTSANNFSGTETFSYTINDGTAGSDDTATVTITVNPGPQVVTYTYDELGRVISADYHSKSNESYEYDSVGNRTLRVTTVTGNTPPIAMDDLASNKCWPGCSD